MTPENQIHYQHYLAYQDWFFISSGDGLYNNQPLFRCQTDAIAHALMTQDTEPFRIQTLKDSDGWIWS